jgi:hypothetical protein
MRVGMDGVRTTDEATGRQTSTSFSYPTYLHLRGSSREVAELFAFHPIQQLNVVVDGLAEVASGQYVSGSYFSALGVQPRHGRLLSDADDRADAAPVATITHAFWQRRFAGDPRVIGRAVLLNRIPFTIVGITPPGFAGALDVTRTPDFTVPFASDRWSRASDPTCVAPRSCGCTSWGGSATASSRSAPRRRSTRRCSRRCWPNGTRRWPPIPSGHAASNRARSPTRRRCGSNPGSRD